MRTIVHALLIWLLWVDTVTEKESEVRTLHWIGEGPLHCYHCGRGMKENPHPSVVHILGIMDAFAPGNPIPTIQLL